MAIIPSRKLHHLSAPGIIQHITFRLNDSLPQSAVDKIERSLSELPEASRNSSRNKQLHRLLDQGIGSCLLRKDLCASIVEKSLLFGHSSRYKLLAWCVMPNHVHVLFEQIEGWGIDRVVHGWKRHTAREIGKLGYQTDSITTGIWQRNYWDRYVRSSDHMVKVKWYIEQNPVRAGLVERAEAWRWSSAFARD